MTQPSVCPLSLLRPGLTFSPTTTPFSALLEKLLRPPLARTKTPFPRRQLDESISVPCSWTYTRRPAKTTCTPTL